MSVMFSFLPMLLERSEILKHAIRHFQDRDKLPVSAPRMNECAIRVVIMDGQEWHNGATAPRIADFLRPHAGKAGGP
jgi:hypothetical protein